MRTGENASAPGADELAALRRELHAHPELSGREARTAARIVRRLRALEPDALVEGLGGHGLAARFDGIARGPTLLLRCELDALPITERSGVAHRSRHDGVAHHCGHDGHMAILVGVARELARKRPAAGRVVLLFQPAEETGHGADAVLSDPRFDAFRPDLAYALHNVPGAPLGAVLLRAGSFACASRGVTVRLTGRTAHAAQPETGVSPTRALTALVERLERLPPELLPGDELAFATVVGARLGERAFGTAPGAAELWVTLRTATDASMARLVEHAERTARELAAAHGLAVDIEHDDVFHATHNGARAVALLRAAAAPLPVHELAEPFRWSEDFGRFTAGCEGALFGLGAGETQPALHDPGYDFPDALLEPAVALLLRVIDACARG